MFFNMFCRQVKKWKGRASTKARAREQQLTELPLGGSTKSPSLPKISPLQQYILEQAKLSGYRWCL